MAFEVHGVYNCSTREQHEFSAKCLPYLTDRDFELIYSTRLTAHIQENKYAHDLISLQVEALLKHKRKQSFKDDKLGIREVKKTKKDYQKETTKKEEIKTVSEGGKWMGELREEARSLDVFLI